MDSVTVNLSGWLGQFQRDCDAAIADLTQVCTAAAEPATYQRHIESYRFGVASISFANLEHVTAVAPERAARTCFLNVIGKYVGFLDRLLASQRLNNLVLDRAISNTEELQAYVSERFKREIAMVARDTSLTNPRKLDAFPKASAYARDTSKVYFQLRRALEHHNDVPDSNLVVPTQRIGFLAGNDEIKTLGVILPAGESLRIKMFDEELHFPAGQEVSLSPQDAYNLVFTMRMGLAPEIFRSHVETP